MKSPLLEMLKLLFYDFVCCAIMYLLLNFSFDFSVQIFVYAAILLIMPYFIKKTNTTVINKFSITALILAISMGATIYAEGVGKTLFNNIIIFTVALTFCIISQRWRRRTS